MGCVVGGRRGYTKKDEEDEEDEERAYLSRTFIPLTPHHPHRTPPP
jgi:hypothetical protein